MRYIKYKNFVKISVFGDDDAFISNINSVYKTEIFFYFQLFTNSALIKKGSVLLWFFQTLKNKNKNVYLRSQKNLSGTGTGTILIHTERYHNTFFFLLAPYS